MGIAENLHALMEHRKVSQYRLAKETGVPQPTIQRILNGRSADPKSGTVKKLAIYFGIEPHELRGPGKDWSEATGKFRALSQDALDLLAAWERLPADRQQAYKDFLFLEVFALDNMPWLKRGRPVKESYGQYERRMVALGAAASKGRK